MQRRPDDRDPRAWTGALGAKLGRILSPHNEHGDEEAYFPLPDDVSVNSLKGEYGGVVVGGKREDSDRVSTPSSPERRSVSRGREAFSSGRGGIGNIRVPSVDAASPSRVADDPLSPVRGREATIDPERAKSSGRGGMGNIRSGSQARAAAVVPDKFPQTASLISDHAASVAEYERSVVQQNEEETNARAHSSGRGGLGNIKSNSKSKSRSRSRVPITSTGRGGVGNLQPGMSPDPEVLAQLEEEDRLRFARDQGAHSTGRGGRANITSLPSPPLEPASPHPHAYAATGRGGVGNIVRSRSASRDLERNRSRSTSRTPSKDRSSSLARIFNKVGLHPSREGDQPEGAHGMNSVYEDEDKSSQTQE